MAISACEHITKGSCFLVRRQRDLGVIAQELPPGRVWMPLFWEVSRSRAELFDSTGRCVPWGGVGLPELEGQDLHLSPQRLSTDHPRALGS